LVVQLGSRYYGLVTSNVVVINRPLNIFLILAFTRMQSGSTLLTPFAVNVDSAFFITPLPVLLSQWLCRYHID